MSEIRIMIVDDSKQILDYLALIIQNEKDMVLAATASNGREAVEKAREYMPDIILMDIHMETETAGIDAMKEIKSFAPEVKFIMSTIYSDDEHIVNSYGAGASDYIVKSSSVTEIVSTIRENFEDSTRTLVSRSLVNELNRVKLEHNSMLLMINKLVRLTPSELQVLKLVYGGKNYREVAKIKYVEEATVRSFANKILKKMEAKNMKSLIKQLEKLGIIELLDMPGDFGKEGSGDEDSDHR